MEKTTDYRNRIKTLEYIDSRELTAHPGNWREHPTAQAVALKGALKEVGIAGALLAYRSERQGGALVVIDGHLRKDAAPQNWPVLILDVDDSEADYLLATHDPLAAMATADAGALDALLSSVQSGEEGVQAMLAELAEEAGLYNVSGVEKKKQPNPRLLPIDVIYTLQMADCTCCIAAQAGIKYGIQSAHYRLCPYTYELSGRHEVTFVDNDYFNYDHAVHLEAVKRFTPRYATVRDIMTELQCEVAGIAYHPLSEILEWADELAEHAENVIVIPKYDCIDKIPQRFMLGYSVPTSHGGTPLSVDLFRGRRVHLLGGSWSDQLAYLAALGDDVVSLDNNYLLKQAGFASFVYPDGTTGSLGEDFGLEVNNPRYVALAISFGNIGAKLNMLYAEKGADDE